MKKYILHIIRYLLKNIKSDSFRLWLMKPLFKLNGANLSEFISYENDRFFIFKVDGIYLPSQDLHWFHNMKRFEKWCDETALFKYSVNENDVVIDIGAGIGEEVMVLANRVGKGGKVYAIEANTQVANILATTVKLNGFKNVDVHNIAISCNNEKVKLIDDEDLYIAGSINANSKSKNSKEYIVDGFRMDSFLEKEGIKKVDLLKSNIEGAERFVVDSLSKENLKIIKYVAIACHDFRYRVDGNEFFKTKDYVSNFLKENGFEIVSQNSGISHIDDYVYGRNKKL